MHRRHTSSRFAPVLVAGLLAAGCAQPPDDQRTDSVDPTTAGRVDVSEAALAQLDSGNVAFRAGELDRALEHYTAATVEAPDAASGWFGIYMVQQQLGNMDAAEEALARAQDAAPGASLIRDTTSAGGGS